MTRATTVLPRLLPRPQWTSRRLRQALAQTGFVYAGRVEQPPVDGGGWVDAYRSGNRLVLVGQNQDQVYVGRELVLQTGATPKLINYLLQ